jgi:hypothetical protein
MAKLFCFVKGNWLGVIYYKQQRKIKKFPKKIHEKYVLKFLKVSKKILEEYV